jgi:general secretion pathway protein A
MYLSFYNLKKEPFHITPDPEFLFLCESNRQAIGAIIWGVAQKKGFISITGDVGVGKTTILRSYLETVDRQWLKVIYLFNANISFPGLLKTIYKELGVDSKTDDVVEMVNQLHEILIEEYKQARNVLLIIDEAQNMPIETLENLRMLSNLETSTDKLIQIVLVGQSEFEERLQRHELRQLNQRIAIRSKIQPFTQEESIAYIKHRLAKAGLNEKDTVFTKGAVKEIVKQAKGVPRILNILCDNTLITGFGYQKKQVNTKIVKEVIADFEGRAKRSLLRWILAPAALLLFLAGILLIYPYKDMLLSKLENPNLSQKREQNQPKEAIQASMENPGPLQIVESAPVEEKIEQSFSSTEVVKKGDNLFRLTKKAYGYADHKLIERVRQNNPRIKDVNKILIGDEIVFPQLSQDQVKAKDIDKAKVEVKAKDEKVENR